MFLKKTQRNTIKKFFYEFSHSKDLDTNLNGLWLLISGEIIKVIIKRNFSFIFSFDKSSLYL